MITAVCGDRLRVVLQNDHAAIAAQFAAAWGGHLFRAVEPLGAVKLAAQVHDQGWQEWDYLPRINPQTRRPYHFMNMEPDAHIAIYRRCIEAALEQHPYAGLLVSLHGTGLYKQRYGHMPSLEYKDVPIEFRSHVEAFLAEQEQVQQELLKDLQPCTETLWTHYRWLQTWDALSVFISLSAAKDRRSFSVGQMPLYPGGPEERLVIEGAGESTFTVSPWPFGLRWLEVFLPVRYVPDRDYASDADFQEAFEAAPTRSLPLLIKPAVDIA